MALIRGILLAGKFRTQHELNGMSDEDQRNTLIVVLTALSNQSNYQTFDNATLAGMGAVLVFLREAKIRDDTALKAMTADDQRNTLIVEIGVQNPHMASRLQSFNNLDLVLLGLGAEDPVALQQPSFLRGVLLAGKFRTQRELNQMSVEDQRNTLIVELAAHSAQSNYQSFDNHALARLGAALVFLREANIRDDFTLKHMSAEKQRNTLIAEIGVQTKLGSRLQELNNMDLVRLALGVDPADVFTTLPGPLQPLAPQRLQFRLRSFVQYESTDSGLQGARDEVWISAIGIDPTTVHIGPDGKVTTDLIQAPVIGDVSDDRVRGPWAQNPFVLLEFDLERLGSYPREYAVTLLIVEEDNEGVGSTFETLNATVGKAAREAVVSAATSAGTAVGTVILPGIGTAVGAAAGFLAGLAWDEIFSAIGDGLKNEVFTPRVLGVRLPQTPRPNRPDEIDRPELLVVEEHGAKYAIVYDWHIEE
jgi:hypothetical protein